MFITKDPNSLIGQKCISCSYTYIQEKYSLYCSGINNKYRIKYNDKHSIRIYGKINSSTSLFDFCRIFVNKEELQLDFRANKSFYYNKDYVGFEGIIDVEPTLESINKSINLIRTFL